MTKDKHKIYKPKAFEYEDYGSPAMYWSAILSVLAAIGLAILFAMVVASGFIYIGSIL